MWHGISYFCLRHEKICFKVYVSCLSVDQPVNMCILVRYISKSDLLFEKIAYAHITYLLPLLTWGGRVE